MRDAQPRPSSWQAPFTRRVMLKGGIAVGAAAVAGAAGRWLVDPHARIDYYKVLFDSQHPAAHSFGTAASEAGLPAQATGRDITALWFDDLHHRWQAAGTRQPGAVPARVAIAGMTPARTAFALQLFAQDAGLRLIYRTVHTPRADGRLEHAVSAPRALHAGLDGLQAGAGWARATARLIAHCPPERSSPRLVSMVSSAAAGFAHDEPLVSWVLAPLPRA